MCRWFPRRPTAQQSAECPIIAPCLPLVQRQGRSPATGDSWPADVGGGSPGPRSRAGSPELPAKIWFRPGRVAPTFIHAGCLLSFLCLWPYDAGRWSLVWLRRGAGLYRDGGLLRLLGGLGGFSLQRSELGADARDTARAPELDAHGKAGAWFAPDLTVRAVEGGYPRRHIEAGAKQDPGVLRRWNPSSAWACS